MPKSEGFHMIENCNLRCSFYNGMGHIQERCWKKNPKVGTTTTNFLEILVDDEKSTLF